MIRRVAVAACPVLIVAACSGSPDRDSAPSPSATEGSGAVSGPSPSAPVAGRGSVKVDLIRSAIELLERRLGDAQRYVEVNVTQTEVNLFVVRDGQDFAYVVRDGAVEDPAEGVPYSGPTFTAARLDFVPSVIDVVVQNMTESEVVAFSARAREGGIDYIATVRTPKREFRVLLAPNGGVLDME